MDDLGSVSGAMVGDGDATELGATALISGKNPAKMGPQGADVGRTPLPVERMLSCDPPRCTAMHRGELH
jgi:hypothetical protein